MSTLRSLRFKIAFVFFLVTAAAFTVIWFGVVPQLEQNLKERRRGRSARRWSSRASAAASRLRSGRWRSRSPLPRTPRTRA